MGIQREYRVEWTIDVPAITPRQACERARVIMRDADSLATLFKVWPLVPWGSKKAVTIDLQEEA